MNNALCTHTSDICGRVDSTSLNSYYSIKMSCGSVRCGFVCCGFVCCGFVCCGFVCCGLVLESFIKENSPVTRIWAL